MEDGNNRKRGFQRHVENGRKVLQPQKKFQFKRMKIELEK